MNNDVEINGTMDLGKKSPLEQPQKITETALIKIIKEALSHFALVEGVSEKAVSKSQQRFFGMVDAYKKGEMPDASPAIKKAAKGMTRKEVKDFAKTKHKGLPDHVDESYSTQGGMTDDADIKTFKKFIHQYPELPQLPWNVGRKDDEIQKNEDVLTLYSDLSKKIYNALPDDATNESYHWLSNAYTYLKRGDMRNANFSYVKSIQTLVDAISKANMYESCNGKNPYCGEKKGMEKAEKNSPDKPMDFNKKQKPIKLTESQLLETVQEILVDVLSKYTKGEATAEKANKAIMDLANSSNSKKLNEDFESEWAIMQQVSEDEFCQTLKNLRDVIVRDGCIDAAEAISDYPIIYPVYASEEEYQGKLSKLRQTITRSVINTLANYDIIYVVANRPTTIKVRESNLPQAAKLCVKLMQLSLSPINEANWKGLALGTALGAASLLGGASCSHYGNGYYNEPDYNPACHPNDTNKYEPNTYTFNDVNDDFDEYGNCKKSPYTKFYEQYEWTNGLERVYDAWATKDKHYWVQTIRCDDAQKHKYSVVDHEVADRETLLKYMDRTKGYGGNKGMIFDTNDAI